MQHQKVPTSPLHPFPWYSSLHGRGNPPWTRLELICQSREQCFPSLVSCIGAKSGASVMLFHATSNTSKISWGVFSIFFHDSRRCIIQQALVDLGCNKSLVFRHVDLNLHALLMHTHKTCILQCLCVTNKEEASISESHPRGEILNKE